MRQVRLETPLARSFATDMGAALTWHGQTPAELPRIARELNAERQESTNFELERWHLGYVG